MVGSKKQSLRFPPKIRSAPSSIALFTAVSTLIAALSLINGPISVDSSIGFPIFNLLAFLTNASKNSSAIPLSRIILLTPMQTCPENRNAPDTAASVAFSMSASSSTTNGSFPPSSNVSFFIPALDEMNNPVATLPVNDILFTSEDTTIASPTSLP